MRFLIIAALVAMPGCGSVKTFSDATDDVNEDFGLAVALRDRCDATGNVDDCLAWREFKKAEEREIAPFDYDKALARWEANGPY